MYMEGNKHFTGRGHLPRGSCGCFLPGNVQGQAGWDLEQPGLAEGIPAHDIRLELDDF